MKLFLPHSLVLTIIVIGILGGKYVEPAHNGTDDENAQLVPITLTEGIEMRGSNGTRLQRSANTAKHSSSHERTCKCSCKIRCDFRNKTVPTQPRQQPNDTFITLIAQQWYSNCSTLEQFTNISRELKATYDKIDFESNVITENCVHFKDYLTNSNIVVNHFYCWGDESLSTALFTREILGIGLATGLTIILVLSVSYCCYHCHCKKRPEEEEYQDLPLWQLRRWSARNDPMVPPRMAQEAAEWSMVYK